MIKMIRRCKRSRAHLVFMWVSSGWGVFWAFWVFWAFGSLRPHRCESVCFDTRSLMSQNMHLSSHIG